MFSYMSLDLVHRSYDRSPIVQMLACDRVGVDEGLRHPTPPVTQHMQPLPPLLLLWAQTINHLLQRGKDCVTLHHENLHTALHPLTGNT